MRSEKQRKLYLVYESEESTVVKKSILRVYHKTPPGMRWAPEIKTVISFVSICHFFMVEMVTVLQVRALWLQQSALYQSHICIPASLNSARFLRSKWQNTLFDGDDAAAGIFSFKHHS